MAWQRIGNRRYFYRSIRVNGRVKSIYVGQGPAAELACLEIETERQRQIEQRECLARLSVSVGQTRQLTSPVTRQVELLARSQMLLAGYRQNSRGPWRMRRKQSA